MSHPSETVCFRVCHCNLRCSGKSSFCLFSLYLMSSHFHIFWKDEVELTSFFFIILVVLSFTNAYMN